MTITETTTAPVSEFLTAVQALALPGTAELTAELQGLTSEDDVDVERRAALSARLREFLEEYERMLHVATVEADDRFPLDDGAVHNGGDELYSFLSQATGHGALFLAAARIGGSFFDPDLLTHDVRVDLGQCGEEVGR